MVVLTLDIQIAFLIVGIGHRLTDIDVVKRRLLRVHGHERSVGRVAGVENEVVVGLGAGIVGRVDLSEISVACLNRDIGCGGLCDRLEGDGFDRGLLAGVIRPCGQDSLLARDKLGHNVRTGADRCVGICVADLFAVGLVQDGDFNQIADEAAVGLLQNDGHDIALSGDAVDLRVQVGGLRDIFQTGQGIDNVLDLQRLAVLEHEAVADSQLIGQLVRLLPGGDHARLEREIQIAVEQIVIDMAHDGKGVDGVGNAGVHVIADVAEHNGNGACGRRCGFCFGSCRAAVSCGCGVSRLGAAAAAGKRGAHKANCQ